MLEGICHAGELLFVPRGTEVADRVKCCILPIATASSCRVSRSCPFPWGAAGWWHLAINLEVTFTMHVSRHTKEHVRRK